MPGFFDSTLDCFVAMACPNISLVTPTGFEPVTYGLGIRRSILLSYGAFERTNRDLVPADQLTWLGGRTGKGNGATGTPSSASSFACSSVARPWTSSRSTSPLCMARAVSAN